MSWALGKLIPHGHDGVGAAPREAALTPVSEQENLGAAARSVTEMRRQEEEEEDEEEQLTRWYSAL